MEGEEGEEWREHLHTPSQTGCFLVFSAQADTGILNMTEPTLHAAHKDLGYTHNHTHIQIYTALQTATCTPCIDPAGLSASLWAQILLNHWLIPSCMSCIPSTKPPSFQPFLFLFPPFFLLHLCALFPTPSPPPVPTHPHPLLLPFAFLPPPPPPRRFPSLLPRPPDNSIINWPS